MAFASSAAGEVEAGAEEAGGLALLIPKPGEFIPMLICFILIWVILAKFAWPTIIGMLDKRVTTISGALEKAEVTRVESERLLEEQKAHLEEAKKQAAQIIVDARTTGEAMRAEMAAQAQEDARLLIDKANAAIEAEKKMAIAQLQSSVANLSVSVAGRLIGQDLSDSDHRKLIERYLAEAGSLDVN
ncbi:MAG: F0F1 ATP synthase subunit B [Coriobacteriales bacterium]|jgi:F-type H+-transporting ATPase subunit b|nr:F0F1 ATP synthase subunit B [Coriobacteriales bacterium]